MKSFKKFKNNSCLVAIFISCALISASCSIGDKAKPIQAVEATNKTEIDEYEVFSAFLNQQEADKSVTLCIRQESSVVNSLGFDEVGMNINSKVLKENPTINEALEALRLRKNDTVTFERAFSINKEYKLIPEIYFRSFFKNASQSEALQKFRAENGGSLSLHFFSRVGFDRQRKIAIFFHELIGNENVGNFQAFKKIGNTWKLIDTFGGYET